MGKFEAARRNEIITSYVCVMETGRRGP